MSVSFRDVDAAFRTMPAVPTVSGDLFDDLLPGAGPMWLAGVEQTLHLAGVRLRSGATGRRLHIDHGGVVACGASATTRVVGALVSPRTVCSRCSARVPDVASVVQDVRELADLTDRVVSTVGNGPGFEAVPLLVSLQAAADAAGARCTSRFPLLGPHVERLLSEVAGTVGPLVASVHARQAQTRVRLLEHFSSRLAFEDLRRMVKSAIHPFTAFAEHPDLLVAVLQASVVAATGPDGCLVTADLVVDEDLVSTGSVSFTELPEVVDVLPAVGESLPAWLLSQWRRHACRHAGDALAMLAVDVDTLRAVPARPQVRAVTGPLGPGLGELYVAWMPSLRSDGLLEWQLPLVAALWLARLFSDGVQFEALPGELSAEFVLRHDDRGHVAATVRLAEAIVARHTR